MFTERYICGGKWRYSYISVYAHLHQDTQETDNLVPGVQTERKIYFAGCIFVYFNFVSCVLNLYHKILGLKYPSPKNNFAVKIHCLYLLPSLPTPYLSLSLTPHRHNLVSPSPSSLHIHLFLPQKKGKPLNIPFLRVSQETVVNIFIAFLLLWMQDQYFLECNTIPEGTMKEWGFIHGFYVHKYYLLWHTHNIRKGDW